LRIEIIHKIAVQERGDRGIEFDSRDHSQIGGSREKGTLEENTRGVSFFGMIFLVKTASKRGHNPSSAR
jgi:hypothetical protein